MQKDRITTAFLLLLLIIVIASSVARWNSLAQKPPNGVPKSNREHSLRKKLSAVKSKQEWDAVLNKLPTADYTAPESNDPEARHKRRVKNSRYDKRAMVVSDPDTSITLTEVVYEGKEHRPLPIRESDIVIIGEVQDRNSYLSNDKSGVYTEFSVSVDELLKGDQAQVNLGSIITASRFGGVVQYPNGHKRLYLVSGEGLPLDPGRYVLFLKRDEQAQSYLVLTMYQLGLDDVTPIDEGVQFEPYKGQKKSEFLTMLQNRIANPS